MIPIILSIALTSLPVDKAAHFGLSYAATHACQVVLDEGLEVDEVASTFICAGAVLAAGSVRELTGNNDPKDMAANIAGVGLAVTFIAIDW